MENSRHRSPGAQTPGFRGRARVTLAILLVTGLLVPALGPAPSAQAVINPGSVAGTVTTLTDDPLPGITVSVLLNNGLALVVVGEDETDATGAYQIDDIAAHNCYTVRFTDPSAAYATEYYNDTVAISFFSTCVPVTASSITTGVDAALEPGASISGQLTTATGAPVTGGKVTVFWKFSPVPGYFTMDTYSTDPTGHYTIDRVKSATYALEFYDPASGNHEFWNNQPDLFGASPVVVASGDSLTGIDAVLGGLVTNVAAPTISGTAQVGQPLTASPGSWTPAGTNVTFRWVVGADTAPSDDPTGSVYTPTQADVGQTIRVHATGTYPGWEAGSAWSSATAVVVAVPVTTPPPQIPPAVTYLVRPRIKGTIEVGQVLRVSKGVWKPAAVTFKYQWYAGAKAITDATHRRLTLTAKYVGKRLAVRIKAKAAGYTTAIVRTKPTARIKP